MKKKFLTFGLIASVSTSMANDGAKEVSNETLDLMDQMGRAEKAICAKLVDYNEMEQLSAQDLIDSRILNSIIFRISDNPIQYCEDRLMNKIEKTNPTIPR